MVALVLLVTLIGGATMASVGLLGLLGRLSPNSLAGIRTAYTRASDENWYAVHRFGGPLLLFGGIPVVSVSLALLPFAAAGKVPDAVTLGAGAGGAAVLAISAVAAWWYGTAMAKAR